MFRFLSWLLSCVEKRFDKKAKVNFKIYDATDWTTINYDTNIPEYLQNYGQPVNEI